MRNGIGQRHDRSATTDIRDASHNGRHTLRVMLLLGGKQVPKRAREGNMIILVAKSNTPNARKATSCVNGRLPLVNFTELSMTFMPRVATRAPLIKTDGDVLDATCINRTGSRQWVQRTDQKKAP